MWAEEGRLEWIQVLPDGTVHVLTEKGVVPGVLRMPENEGEFMDVCEIDLALCTDTPADSAQIDMNSLSKNMKSLSKNPNRQAPVWSLLAGFTLVSVAFVCLTFLLAWSVHSLSTLLNSTQLYALSQNSRHYLSSVCFEFTLHAAGCECLGACKRL